jgi:hypothetical protein
MKTSQQRNDDVWASNVLFWGALVFPLVMMTFKTAVLHRGLLLPAVKDTSGGLVLLLVLCYAIRLGKTWPKFVVLAIFVLPNVLSLLDRTSILDRLRADSLFLLTFTVGNAVLLWVLVLLFKKPSPQVA